jgi:hypothetical protein
LSSFKNFLRNEIWKDIGRSEGGTDQVSFQRQTVQDAWRKNGLLSHLEQSRCHRVHFGVFQLQTLIEIFVHIGVQDEF